MVVGGPDRDAHVQRLDDTGDFGVARLASSTATPAATGHLVDDIVLHVLGLVRDQCLHRGLAQPDQGADRGELPTVFRDLCQLTCQNRELVPGLLGELFHLRADESRDFSPYLLHGGGTEMGNRLLCLRHG